MKSIPIKKTGIILLLALLFVFLYFALSSLSFIRPESQSTNPLIKNGILDLRDFTLDRPIHLTGDWLFLPEENYTKKELLPVPGSWETVKNKNYGSARYFLKIILPKNAESVFGLSIPELDQNITVYINEKKIIHPFLPNKKNIFSQQIIPIHTHNKSEITIEIALKNNYFRKGGLVYAPSFGSLSRIIQNYFIISRTRSIILGFILFTSCFFFFLYITRYPNSYTICLSLAALFFTIRFTTSNDFLVLGVFVFFTPIVKYKAYYVSTYFGLISLLPFFNSVSIAYKRGTNIYSQSLFIIGIILGLSSLFMPIQTLSKTVFLVELYALFFCFFAIMASFPTCNTKKIKHNIILFPFSIVSILLLLFHIKMTNAYIQSLLDMSDIAILVFIIAVTFVVSYTLSKTTLKKIQLTEELEEKVLLRTKQLNESVEQLTLLSVTDPLTGIFNRRKFFELGKREVLIHNRYNRLLSIILIDIDFFKKVNDTYGHKMGDEALCFLTKIIGENIRATDIFARLGGEEFAILLLETSLEKGKEIAEAIRKKVAKESKNHPIMPTLTVSMGISNLKNQDTIEDALMRADKLLYEAKDTGRNCVLVETS